MAAHYAAAATSEPAAAEAILAWGSRRERGAGAEPVMDAMPAAIEVAEDGAVLPAYQPAADQAEQLLTHFDDEELFDLSSLYGRVISIIEHEIERIGPA